MSSSNRPRFSQVEQVNRILEDFIFLDCRLADHPKVHSVFYRLVGGKLVLVAQSRGVALSPDRISFPTLDSFIRQAIRAKEDTTFIPSSLSFSKYVCTPGPTAGSIVVVPVGTRDNLFGALSFESPLADIFDSRHFGRAHVLSALLANLCSTIDISQRVRNKQSEALGWALAAIRRELRLTKAQIANQISTTRIAVSRMETGAQTPSVNTLYRWCEALGLLQSKPHALVTTVDITPELLRILRQDPEVLHQLSPETFENLIRERLDRIGFETQKTGSTTLRDGGIDFIAVPKIRTVATYLMAVQVKHHIHGAKTGRAPVDRLLSWKDNFRLGLLITNTGFTRDALWTAWREQNKNFLRLRDFDDLKRWLEGNFWSPDEWRELPAQIEVAPGIVIDIPKGELRNWFDIWPF